MLSEYLEKYNLFSNIKSNPETHYNQIILSKIDLFGNNQNNSM